MSIYKNVCMHLEIYIFVASFSFVIVMFCSRECETFCFVRERLDVKLGTRKTPQHLWEYSQWEPTVAGGKRTVVELGAAMVAHEKAREMIKIGNDNVSSLLSKKQLKPMGELEV